MLPPLHHGTRPHVGYAGARNGLNFRSALAAKIKSLSVRPLILCDQISILHFPRPDTDQDDGPSASATAPTLFANALAR